jgi:hypothetical protein
MDSARRLIPILSALKLGEDELEASGLMPDSSRYLFFLPLLLSAEYAQLLRSDGEASQVILSYYFALVRRLLSGKFWWMRERSARLCEWLLTRLGNKCERCVGGHATSARRSQFSSLIQFVNAHVSYPIFWSFFLVRTPLVG